MTGLVKAQFPEIEETESFIQQAIGDSDATQVRNNPANINLQTL